MNSLHPSKFLRCTVYFWFWIQVGKRAVRADLLLPGPEENLEKHSRFGNITEVMKADSIRKLASWHRLSETMVDLFTRDPEQWRRSSYCFYFLDQAAVVRVNVGWTEISFRDRVA